MTFDFEKWKSYYSVSSGISYAGICGISFVVIACIGIAFGCKYRPENSVRDMINKNRVQRWFMKFSIFLTRTFVFRAAITISSIFMMYGVHVTFGLGNELSDAFSCDKAVLWTFYILGYSMLCTLALDQMIYIHLVINLEKTMILRVHEGERGNHARRAAAAAAETTSNGEEANESISDDECSVSSRDRRTIVYNSDQFYERYVVRIRTAAFLVPLGIIFFVRMVTLPEMIVKTDDLDNPSSNKFHHCVENISSVITRLLLSVYFVSMVIGITKKCSDHQYFSRIFSTSSVITRLALPSMFIIFDVYKLTYLALVGDMTGVHLAIWCIIVSVLVTVLVFLTFFMTAVSLHMVYGAYTYSLLSDYGAYMSYRNIVLYCRTMRNSGMPETDSIVEQEITEDTVQTSALENGSRRAGLPAFNFSVEEEIDAPRAGLTIMVPLEEQVQTIGNLPHVTPSTSTLSLISEEVVPIVEKRRTRMHEIGTVFNAETFASDCLASGRAAEMNLLLFIAHRITETEAVISDNMVETQFPKIEKGSEEENVVKKITMDDISSTVYEMDTYVSKILGVDTDKYVIVSYNISRLLTRVKTEMDIAKRKIHRKSETEDKACRDILLLYLREMNSVIDLLVQNLSMFSVRYWSHAT